MVKLRAIEKSEIANESYKSKGYQITQANGPSRRKFYCPVTRWKLSQVCVQHNLVLSVSDIEEQCAKAYDSMYVLDDTSAVLMPFYVVDRPANRADLSVLDEVVPEEEAEELEEDNDSDDTPEEDTPPPEPVKKDHKVVVWDARREHYRFFTDAVNLLKFKDGSHPNILYPDDQDVNPKYIYFDMKKTDMVEMAEKFYGYILNHRKIKSVFIPDISLARLMFPDMGVAKSLKDAAYVVYDANISLDREVRVMILPSPIQLNKLEEKGWEFCQEILEIARNKKSTPPINVTVLTSLDQVKEVLGKLAAANTPRIAVDTETTGLNPVFYNQAIISCAFSDGINAWSFLVNHPKRKDFDGSDMLRYLLDFEGIPVQVYQNAKYDMKWFMHLFKAVPKAKIRDTMLIDHWLHENYGSLSKKIKVSILGMDAQIPRYLYMNSHKDMLAKYLEIAPTRNPNKPKKAKDMDITDDLLPLIEEHNKDMHERFSGAYAEIPLDVLLLYNGKDTWMTCNIYDKMLKLIYEETGTYVLPRVIQEIHEKQIHALAEMELLGAPINYEYLVEMVEKATAIAKERSKKLLTCIDRDVWEKRPRTVSGEEKRVEMNLESQAQLLYYLGVKYGIKKSAFWDEDKGRVIADEDSLLAVCDKMIPWMKDYVVFKKALKARNTYIIPFVTNSYKGRLYFNLNITGTATGRLSSDRPNLQNLPVSFMGKSKTDRIDIKPIIEAPDGQLTWNMDFKNLEMKVLTVYCKDPALVKAISDGLDLHCYTASLVNEGVSYAEIIAAQKKADNKERKEPFTDREHELLDMRQAAKRVIFGVVYGIGSKGLYSKIPLPESMTKEQKLNRAQELLDNLKTKAYPELLNTFDKTDKTILARGYVETIFGRRRRFHFSLAKVISDIFFKADLVVLKTHSKADSLTRFPAKAIRDVVPNKRAFRQGLNFLVQSSGSDYTQLFIAECRRLMEGKFNTQLLFTVHDSCTGVIDDTPEAKEFLDKTLREAGLNYIRTIAPDYLPVDIGYSYETSKKYCEKH